MVTLAMMIILEALRVMDTRFMLMRALPVQILLVEDDEIDQMAVRRAFRRSQIDNDIVIAGDGLEALEMLRDQRLTQTARGFAAVALGMVCDKDMLPWSDPLSVGVNYRATTSTLTGGSTGVLDIL